MHEPEPSTLDEMVDLVSGDAERIQLPASDGRVLASGEHRNDAIAVMHLSLTRWFRVNCGFIVHGAMLPANRAQISTRVLRIARRSATARRGAGDRAPG